MRLDDQVVIVTGSSRGIGRAIAEILARKGARVVIVARHAGPCEEVGLGSEPRAERQG